MSIVLGIIGIVFVLLLPILGILLSIAGVVLGFLSRSREPGARSLATIGIVLGFVGIAVNIAWIIIGAVIIASVVNGS